MDLNVDKFVKYFRELDRKEHAIYIINGLNCDITIEWENKSEKDVISDKMTKIYTIDKSSYDASANYKWIKQRCMIWNYDHDKLVRFWAYGDGAPRDNNKFIINEDGVYLISESNVKYLVAKWSPIKRIFGSIAPIQFKD